MINTAPIGPYELRIENGRVVVFRHDIAGGTPLAQLDLDLVVEGAPVMTMTPLRFDLGPGGSFDMYGQWQNIYLLEARLTEQTEPPAVRLRLRFENPGKRMMCRLGVRLTNLVGDGPQWMIPGIFYKSNRPPGCQRMYPAFDPGRVEPEKMISNAWSFRSDRAATPGVFAFTSRVGAFIFTDERVGVTDQNRMGIGMTGLKFRTESGTHEIGVELPYTEEPAKFSFCHPEMTTAEDTLTLLEGGSVLEWDVMFGLTPPHPHNYAPVLRAQSKRLAVDHPVKPWMLPEEAETLAAECLLDWHADPDTGVVFETAAFDKYFGSKGTHVDRRSMHVAWQSGAPVAYTMLWRGYATEDPNYILMARAALDRIAEGISPPGLFWAEWVDGEGWTTGWSPEENWIQARTPAEATLFMVRAVRMEALNGQSHPNWIEAVRSNLDFAVRHQNSDGNFGACYDIERDQVAQWDGCAGMSWISALVAGLSLIHTTGYREAAVRAGNYYARFVEDEFLFGSAEDLYLTPSVEDGHCAMIAYTLLYELDRDPKWLELAKRAADWALTFRFTYNVGFARTTLLGAYDYRTRGGDVRSPAHQAINAAGLMAYPEYAKLSMFTGDPYYRDRAEEQRLCHLQLIARDDGDFGARRGMVPDQIYHTDWWQPKGRMLSLSAAWCASAVLYANMTMRSAATTVAGQPPPVERPATPSVFSPRAVAQPPAKPPSPARPAAPRSPAAKPAGPARAAELDRPWSPGDPRDTQEIKVKWKIF